MQMYFMHASLKMYKSGDKNRICLKSAVEDKTRGSGSRPLVWMSRA